MADNPLKHSDLVVNDGAIDELIDKLEKLNVTYDNTLKTVKDQAIKVESSIEKVNSSTAQQRDTIEQAAIEADKLAKAQQNLAFSQSETAKEIAALKAEQQQQNRVTKLQIKLANSAEGSYDKLSAQYSLNKIELNQMSEAQRKNTKAGRELEAQSKDLYEQMKELQAATGNNSLNVGNYTESIGQLIPALGGAIEGAKGFGAQLWALAANPVGAVILAIVGALATLYSGFTRTSAGAEFLEKSMATLGAVFDTVSVRIGRFASGEITLTELLFDTRKEVEANIRAAQRLVEVRRSLEIETAAAALSEAGLAKEIARTRAERDNDGRSLSQRRAAAIEFAELSELQAKNRVTLARREQAAAQLAFDGASKSGENYRQTQIALIEAMANTANAEAELIDVRGEAATQLEMIRLDIFEQELDLLLDITDRQKTINEQRIANEELTVNQQRALADENTRIIEDAFQKQIRAFEELNGVQLDQQLLLSSTGEEIFQYADALGLAERTTNRLREVVIEKLQADQDNLQTLRDIRAEELRLEEERRKRIAAQDQARLAAAEREAQELNALRLSEIELLEATEEEKTRLRLAAERQRLESVLRINEIFGKELSRLQIEQIKNQIALIDRELAGVSEDATRKDIYDVIGLKLNDEDKASISNSVSVIKDAFLQVVGARLEASRIAVENSRSELDNARANLDAQLALANAGQEANVEAALEAFNQRKAINQRAIEDQRKAQRAQQQIESAQQLSALVTATANIFKGFSSIPIIGQVLAIAAVASMFGAFASAKIQAARATRRFGSGGTFDINGGSHASGNDVSLGVHNGVEMKAEGGEKAAIFSKTAVGKYGSGRLNDIIKSINNGSFNARYSGAFGQAGATAALIAGAKGADTRELMEENIRLREDLQKFVKDTPKTEMHWNEEGYQINIRKKNTLFLNVENENSYGG